MIATVYRVKFVSQSSAIAVIIVLLTTFISTIAILGPKTLESIPTSLFISSIALVSYILWQKFVTGRTEWIISDDTLKITWTKRPLERTKDYNLKRTEISKISQGSDRNYYHLKIDLTSGDRLNFFHDPLTTKDDFESLIQTLHQIGK
jgi:hypothetical protein